MFTWRTGFSYLRWRTPRGRDVVAGVVAILVAGVVLGVAVAYGSVLALRPVVAHAPSIARDIR